MNRKTLLTILQYVIFLGLGILLIWWQASKIDTTEKEQIAYSLAQVKQRFWLIIPVIIIGFLSHYFRAVRWKILLEPLQLRPTTVNITCAVLVGYLVNLLVPRMGEVARCTVLAKYEHEPVDKIIGTIVAERSFDLICLLLFGILTFALQVNVVTDYFQAQQEEYSRQGPVLFIVLAAISVIVLALIIIYKKTKHSRVGLFLLGIAQGAKSIMKMKKKYRFLFYTVMIWLCYLSLIYIGFKAMEATEFLSPLAAMSVLVFGSIGMIITPGGLGAYPLAVQKVLVVYNIPHAPGFTFGWVSWSAQTAIILVLGLISLLVLPAYNRVPHGETAMDKE